VALLLVGVAVVLGATVFRTDIAQATGLAQAVTVDNTSSNPVPVREVDTDSNVGGAIRVHEAGTARVDISDPSVPTQQAGDPVAVKVEWVSHNLSSYTVPADMRFVIESVEGFTAQPQGLLQLSILPAGGGNLTVRYVQGPGRPVNGYFGEPADADVRRAG